jgi:hypothetical protein
MSELHRTAPAVEVMADHMLGCWWYPLLTATAIATDVLRQQLLLSCSCPEGLQSCLRMPCCIPALVNKHKVMQGPPQSRDLRT